MFRRIFRPVVGASCTAASIVVGLLLVCPTRDAGAQTVDDGSDAVIGKAAAQTVLALVRSHLDPASEPKVTELRKSKGSIVCGSVDVKGKEGRYLGERGFVVDLAVPSFGRVPEGVELLNPRAADFDEKEKIRAQYFEMCLD